MVSGAWTSVNKGPPVERAMRRCKTQKTAQIRTALMKVRREKEIRSLLDPGDIYASLDVLFSPHKHEWH